MGYQKVDEKIQVIAEFKGGLITPRVFRWGRRIYKVEKVNLSYQEREGSSINYYFSATTSGGIYKIYYNNEKLTWTLEEYYIE